MPSPLVSHYRSAAKHSEDRSPPCIGSRKWRISRPWHTRARFREDSRFSSVYAKVAVNIEVDDPRRRFASIRGVTRDRSQRETTGYSTQATYLLYEQKNVEWPRNRCLEYCPRSLSQQRSPRIFVPFDIPIDRYGSLAKKCTCAYQRRYAYSLHPINRYL